jgi:hypothetical protein
LEDAFKLLSPEIDSAATKVTSGNLDFILPYTHIDGLFDLARKVGAHQTVGPLDYYDLGE